MKTTTNNDAKLAKILKGAGMTESEAIALFLNAAATTKFSVTGDTFAENFDAAFNAAKNAQKGNKNA